MFLFTDSLKIKLDEVITECFANVKTGTVNGYTSNQHEVTLGKYFVYESFDAVPLSHAGQLIKYVFRVFQATQKSLNNNVISNFATLTNLYLRTTTKARKETSSCSGIVFCRTIFLSCEAIRRHLIYKKRLLQPLFDRCSRMSFLPIFYSA